MGILIPSLLAASCIKRSQDQDDNSKKPNVLLIVSDDQGYGDFAIYDGVNDVHTPHLDQLAENGTRFSNAYVTMSICSPSRCAILTGRHQQRWGVFNYGSSLPRKEVTLAEQLQKAGYKTGMVGKSHYGGYGGPDSPEFPLSHGFDFFFGKEGGTLDYLRHTQKDREIYSERMANHLGVGPFYKNDTLVDKEGYSTDLITHQAVSFINRNRQDPFFLMVSFNEVHLFTHQLPENALDSLNLNHVSDWYPDNGTWDQYLKWYVNTVKPNTPKGRKRYLYHLNKLDQAVGKIVHRLQELKLRENTIIFYISDNGGSPRTYAINKPLRGNKYILEEGGIRVPFVISWPGNIPEGKIYDNMVSALDIFPTLHSMLNIQMPSGRPYDGTNLMPYINGDNKGKPHESLYWTGFSMNSKKPDINDPQSVQARYLRTFHGERSGWAIRHHNWKLRYLGQSKKLRLYNLEKDIDETNDLSEKYPQKVDSLKSRFFTWYENTIPEKHQKKFEQ